MKRIIFKSLSALLLFAQVCVSSCGGDSPTAPSEPDTLQEPLPIPGLSFNSITFPNEGDSFGYVIHGLTDGQWEAESNQPWCNVNIKGNILKIITQPNEQSAKRSAVVSIIHTDKRIMGEIIINQCSIVDNEALKAKTSTKQSFFPLFTATWCPYCPSIDRALEEIQKRYDNPILPMRIHVNSSELYTPLSVELAEQYNNQYVPCGYFDNNFYIYNTSDGNTNIDLFWNNIQYLTHGYYKYYKYYKEGYSYINSTAQMDDHSIDVQIAIIPTETYLYRLFVFIVEDNIICPQMSETEGRIPNYRHDGILVGALTSLKGEEFELTKAGKAFSIKGEIPSNVNLSNLRLLIVLERYSDILNLSDDCWFVDNCLSIPLGKTCGNGQIENIYIGEEIEN